MSVSSALLAQLRTTINPLAFPESCVVKTHPATATTVTNDGATDDSDAAWTATTVSCRVAPAGGSAPIIGMKRAAEADKLLAFPVGTAITAYDRVVYLAKTYQVIETDAPRSNALSVRVLTKAIL